MVPPSYDSGLTQLLSGWWLTYPSEKYEFVSWDDISQYGKKCSKPQTSYGYHHQ
jgi:hypothetical protein